MTPRIGPMTFSEWLDAEYGRATKVAEHFGVSAQAVSLWRTNGVPRDRIIPMRDLTDGAVTLEELVERPRPPCTAPESASAR